MKQFSPAADRNKEPIFQVLKPYLPAEARVFEVSSGTGQHAAYICQQRADIQWQPTDVDAIALASIEAYRSEQPTGSFLAPRRWDTRDAIPKGEDAAYDLVVNINMIHIAPWEAGQSLFVRAAALLKPGAHLFLYGPFFEAGEVPAPSNVDFDQSLKSRNEAWGIRDLEVVKKEAQKNGLTFVELVKMPAHNLSVIFKHKL